MRRWPRPLTASYLLALHRHMSGPALRQREVDEKEVCERFVWRTGDDFDWVNDVVGVRVYGRGLSAGMAKNPVLQ